MNQRVRRFLFVVLAGWIQMTVCVPSSYSQNMEKLSIGEAHYIGHCAGCHGFGGAGDGPFAVGMAPAPTNFRSATPTSLPDNTIEQAILTGKGPMRSYATIFRSEDIREIISYMRSLATPQ